MPEKGERRLAASVIVDALQSIHPLMNHNCSIEQYFEAVEALCWLASSRSDRYFDIIQMDGEKMRSRIDLAFYAELALQSFNQNRASMKRMYVALIRYAFDGGRKIPYKELAAFAEISTSSTEELLTRVMNTRTPGAVKLPAFLEVLNGAIEAA